MCCVYQEHIPLGRGATRQGHSGVNMSISNLFSIRGWPEEACKIGRASLWCSVLPSHHCIISNSVSCLEDVYICLRNLVRTKCIRVLTRVSGSQEGPQTKTKKTTPTGSQDLPLLANDITGTVQENQSRNVRINSLKLTVIQ